MADVTALQAAVDAIATEVVDAITDLTAIEAELKSLKGQTDPTLQPKIDAMVAKLGQVKTDLTDAVAANQP